MRPCAAASLLQYAQDAHGEEHKKDSKRRHLNGKTRQQNIISSFRAGVVAFGCSYESSSHDLDDCGDHVEHDENDHYDFGRKRCVRSPCSSDKFAQHYIYT